MADKRIMIAGGGPAGVSAALKAASEGNHVYLVEPGLGLSVQNGQAGKILKNDRIKVVENAELKGLKRNGGGFKVKILKRAVRVDKEKCDGCKECIRVCPIHMWDDADMGLYWRTAIDFHTSSFPRYAVVKEDMPACQKACPANVDIRKYVGLIADGRFAESLKVINDAILFAGIIGRVCPHPCEDSCNRKYGDEPICVRMLKRFVADEQIKSRAWPEADKSLVGTRPEKVAIIGCGPAGLAAAHDLAISGYKVTIFEKLPVAGGMLRVGIPDYRLPPDIIEREVRYVSELGVDIRLSAPVGPPDLTIDDLMKKHGYKSVLIAVGAHKSMKLGIPNEEGAKGVVHGVDFLREHNLGKKVWVGSKVGVVGGGNVAMDAARVSLRLGAKEVWILYRRSRKEMPASNEEIEAAMHEGIKFEFLVAPEQVLLDGDKVSGCRFIRMELGEPDASGRRRPVPVKGSEFDIEMDMLVPAIGQRSDLSFLTKDDGIQVTEWESVGVNQKNFMTQKPGVFACGDCDYGPSIAIRAIAAGRKAARHIEAYINGKEVKEQIGAERANNAEEKRRYVIEFGDIPAPRAKMPELGVGERIDNFTEVERGFSPEQAMAEARRCLSCRRCLGCALCWAECKPGAIRFDMLDEVLDLEVDQIVLSPPAAREADAPPKGWKYGEAQDVLTAAEFERVLSDDGPFGGLVLRPSNGEVPAKILLVQAVADSAAEMARLARRALEKLPEAALVCLVDDKGAQDPAFAGVLKDFAGKATILRGALKAVEAGERLTAVGADGWKEKFDLVVAFTGLKRPAFLADMCKKTGLKITSRLYRELEDSAPAPAGAENVFVAGWKL